MRHAVVKRTIEVLIRSGSCSRNSHDTIGVLLKIGCLLDVLDKNVIQKVFDIIAFELDAVITNLKLGQNAIENWATDDRQS
jgi:hypothetical protein